MWEIVRAIDAAGLEYKGVNRGWHRYDFCSFSLYTKRTILANGITAGPFMLKIDDSSVYAYPYPVEGEENYPKLHLTTYPVKEAPEIADLVDDPFTLYVGIDLSNNLYLARIIQ